MEHARLAADYVLLLEARTASNVSELRRQVADKYPEVEELRSI